jgi:hypothetical protein
MVASLSILPYIPQALPTNARMTQGFLVPQGTLKLIRMSLKKQGTEDIPPIQGKMAELGTDEILAGLDMQQLAGRWRIQTGLGAPDTLKCLYHITRASRMNWMTKNSSLTASRLLTHLAPITRAQTMVLCHLWHLNPHGGVEIFLITTNSNATLDTWLDKNNNCTEEEYEQQLNTPS